MVVVSVRPTLVLLAVSHFSRDSMICLGSPLRGGGFSSLLRGDVGLCFFDGGAGVIELGSASCTASVA